MFRLKRIFLAAFLAFAVVAPAALRAAEDGRKAGAYKFMANFGVTWGGESASTLEAMYTKLAESIRKKTGLEIEMIPSQSDEEILEKLAAGEVDGAVLQSLYYLQATERKMPVRPMWNYAINGSQSQRVCLYVREGSPEAEGFGNLREKRVMLNGGTDWIYLQNHLAESGSREKLWDYFAKVIPGGNPQSELYALIFKKADAVVMTEANYMTESRADKKFKKTIELVCMGDYPNGPTVVHKKADGDDAETLTKIFLGMHKDKDFKEFHMYFIALNARFARVTPEFYEPFRERIAAARKAGWFEDFEKWMEQQK